MKVLLKNKNIIVYGAGGGIGGGLARTFAREGARVFLAGRTRESLLSVAADIAAAGGSAEVAVDAAIEAFMRCLAAELGPHGIRVLGLWPAGVPETLLPEKIASVNSTMQIDAAGLDRLIKGLAGMTMLRRAPSLAQVAEVAAFLASDRSSAMTSTITNVSCGMVPG